MEKFRDSGATVLMVSHSVDKVLKFCNRALWLDRGEIKLSGQADEVCKLYENEMSA